MGSIGVREISKPHTVTSTFEAPFEVTNLPTALLIDRVIDGLISLVIIRRMESLRTEFYLVISETLLGSTSTIDNSDGYDWLCE